MAMKRQTIVVEYPGHFSMFTPETQIQNCKIISATLPEEMPERSRLTISIEIDRPRYEYNGVVDAVSESILAFLEDDAEGQREPLITQSMHPRVTYVQLDNIVT